MSHETDRHRPLVLVSNDDGYQSPGIAALSAALRTWAEVVVVAPETEQSASSHSLSLHRPLRARCVGPNVFSIDGTPADCVYVALHAGTRFLPRRPDLVCSGINAGLNLGQDAFYSGTVAAAREGALRGIASIAVSAPSSAELSRLAEYAARFSHAVYTEELPTQRGSDHRATPLFNVNFPGQWTGEVRITRLGTRHYEETICVRTDPRGREYMWVGGPFIEHGADPGSDTWAYDDGAASITPLVLDLTSPSTTALERLMAAM